MNVHKKAHDCHEKYCKKCKDVFNEDHQCYMQPVDNKEKTIKGQDRKQHTTYIFFDFECTQDDVIQCDTVYNPNENGKCTYCLKSWCGTFEHRPNLCVAHKV